MRVKKSAQLNGVRRLGAWAGVVRLDAAAVLLALTACSATSSPHGVAASSSIPGVVNCEPHGAKVAGTLRMVGGLPPGIDRAVTGDVTAINTTTGQECGGPVTKDGRFTLYL